MSDPQTVRLPLPDGDGPPALIAVSYRPELIGALGELHAAAVKRDELDDETTEIVRMRCAVWHECRVCQSLRYVSAGERVVDESVASKVIDYENSDLDERHKVALRLADAFMTVPGALSPQLQGQILEHFTPGQVVEMLLDIIAWTQQKPLVSLALDIPPTEISSIEFDESGHYAIGLTPV